MQNAGATVENVSKSFNSARALRGVSTVFESARVHGVIGPNGAGKTTLLRLMTGLLRPESGRIIYVIDGVTKTPLEAKGQLGYFPQEPSLYPDLTCMEHMRFFGAMYALEEPEFEQRCKALFEATNMSAFKGRSAGKLSGGMYKKLGLMCALLNRPRVLILDEPTIGVDPLSRRELWDLIYRFIQNSMTVILSTSYMEEALRCSKVHVLNAGALLAAGAPRQLMEDYKLKRFEDIFFVKEKH